MEKIGISVLKFYNKKWIKFFVIPIILLSFWIGSSLLLNSYVSFTTLTKDYGIDAITALPQGKLMKGESITGQITATENDLGILSVRFRDHDSVNYYDQDSLLFRIKAKGAKTWQYQNIYKSNAISGMPLYPFGFPKFSDSKGKTYVFSFTSLKGDTENALQISTDEPVIVSRYVFTKSELFANKKQALHYLVKKAINAFTDSAFIASSLAFGLPLLFYLLWMGISFKLQDGFYKFLFIVPLLISVMISVHIDLIPEVFWGVIVLWIIIIGVWKVESSISFFFAILFFILAFGSVLIGDQDLAGSLSNWTYVFLVIGAIQLPWELQRSSEKKTDFKKEASQPVALVQKRKKK